MMMNTTDLIEAIENACGQHDWEFHTDYSGRGMYGARCVAVSADETDVRIGLLLAAEIAEHFEYRVDGADAVDGINQLAELGVRTDNMGYGVVVYWPRLTVETAEEAA